MKKIFLSFTQKLLNKEKKENINNTNYIKRSLENTKEYQNNSPNAKFYETKDEEELSFQFFTENQETIKRYETIIFESVNSVRKTVKRWSKTAVKEDIIKEIELCNIAINDFEELEKFMFSN